MRYNVAQLLKDHTGQTRHYTLREDIAALDPDIAPLSLLTGAIRMIRTTDGVLVTGDLRCSLELTCARCLEPFTLPLQFSLEEEFRPTLDIFTGASLPVAADDEAATRIDEHHELDLTEVVRQNLLLAVPPSPVCRSKCAGLCALCGKNLNEGPCTCEPVSLDPRLAVLRQLLDEDKQTDK